MLSKAIVFQHILSLFNGKVFGERVHEQVAVFRADGAVAAIGWVLVQGRG